MSETITTNNGEQARPVTTISETVIRIAGNSQDGIQAIGGFLARLAGRSEQEVMTFMTIPSTISGGPSIFQVRIGTGEVLSSGDEADVLLAFYQHSYEGHIGFLKKGGIVLYDSDHVEPKSELQNDYRHVGVAMSNLTVEAIGGTSKDKGKNIFALGLIARMFDLNIPKLENLVTERFSGKDKTVVINALTAFNAGYNYPLNTAVEMFRFEDAKRQNVRQVVMNGNEAIAFGLIAAGVRFGAAYPITPWTDIMEILRVQLPKYGGMFIQCEDEIASICMALGASYGGRVAVTGTSGPGVSLKSEALGWGIISETPLVIIDVQRGGPSTGLPTQVEQSDLNIACFGSHGDAPRVVLAPANVEDCFYTAIEAVKTARKYSVPVIVLTDQAIGARVEAFKEPDLKNVCQEMPLDLTPVEQHKPFDLSAEDGITYHIAPGTPVLNGKYPVAPGLEHDEFGQPSASPKYHMEMTAKRRKKIQAYARTLPAPEVYGDEDSETLLISWGSASGPVREAVDQVRKSGGKLALLNLRHVYPVPPGLKKIISKFKNIFVVEANDEGLYGYGQLAGILRSIYCNANIRGINKTEGLTFKVKEVIKHLNARLQSA